MSQGHFHRLRRWLRLIRVGLHILGGATTSALVYPLVKQARRDQLKQRWSSQLLDILGLHLEADLQHVVSGSMLVANHISWLDIFIINAVLPSAFVSKSEIRAWPVIGRLAAANETIFLKRGCRQAARSANQEIGQKLRHGRHVAVFPEGTTTDGLQVSPFHAALLQPALIAACPIVPLAISYWEENGERSLAPRYDGDISFAQSLYSIASRQRLVARLHSLPPVDGDDRRCIAERAHQSISRAVSQLRTHTKDIDAECPR